MQPVGSRIPSLTGYRRGIGREFPLRLAREGAGIALAAKPEESTEDLPGRASTRSRRRSRPGAAGFSAVRSTFAPRRMSKTQLIGRSRPSAAST